MILVGACSTSGAPHGNGDGSGSGSTLAIEAFSTSPLAGLGSLQYKVTWQVTGASTCTLTLGDGTPDVVLDPCDAGALDHAYPQGAYDTQLVAHDALGYALVAKSHVFAPADLPITGATVRFELRALVDSVAALAWSPDGSLLATTSPTDPEISLWTADGTRVAGLAGVASYGGATLAWSADGHRLAVGAYDGSDGAIDVWDVTSPATPTQLAHIVVALGGAPTAIAISPDGTRVAAAAGVAFETYDVASGVAHGYFTGPTHEIDALAYSPDGATIASGAEAIDLWRADSDGNAALVTSFPSAGMTITSLAWSPDGTRLAAGGEGYEAAGANRPELCTVGGACTRLGTASTEHAASGLHVAWSPDGTQLASIATDEASATVMLWDPATGARTGTIAEAGPLHDLAWGAGDRLALATSAATVRVVHAGVEQVMLHRLAIGPAAIDPSGTYVALGEGDTLRVREAATGAIVAELPLPGVGVVRWRPDGAQLAATSAQGLTFVRASDWTIVHQVADEGGQDLAYAPDGARLALGHSDGTVELVANDGTPLRTVSLQPDSTSYTANGIVSLAWSPDGTYLAAMANDDVLEDTLDVFDPATGGDGMALDAYDDPVAWSRLGTLAYVTGIGEIGLRTSLDPAAQARSIGGNYAQLLAWSPWGGKLAVANGPSVSLFDTQASGGATLARHTQDVTSISWSADARTFVTTGADGRLVVWSLAYAE